MPEFNQPATLGLTTIVAAVAAVGAATLAPGEAAAAPKGGPVVLSPAPGERIAQGPVRIAVRAGKERRDLRATLNGVAIGAELRRFPGSLRRLPVSHSHGLRHGVNVLKVQARLRGVTRRATVRFRVPRNRPLAGAGRDTRAAVGAATRLRGRFAPHRRGVRAGRVRWTVVKAPAASRLLRRRPAAGPRGRRASAAQTMPASRQLPDGGLTSTFTPDVLGRYVVQMTAAHPGGTVADTVAIDVVPRSAAVVVDTAIEGADPPGTTSYGSPADAARRSGIRVGDVVYRVPWMQTNGATGTDSGQERGTGVWYSMTWQILVLDRRTLAFVDNRVYGRCENQPPADTAQGTSCTPGPDGRLVPADLRADLLAHGPERLVIAALQPLRGQNFHDGWNPARIEPLTAIGFPAPDDPFWPSGYQDFQGRIAGIGVPTMGAGAATLSYVPSGRGRLWGALTADDTNHFGFQPGSREQFDTRAAASCAAAVDGSCTVAHSIGGETRNGSIAKGAGGYLVTLLDRWSLSPSGTRAFATGSADGGASVRAMTQYLNAAPADGASMVLITSLTTPGKAITTDPGTSKADWAGLSTAIAGVGGTRHRFNTAASTPNMDWSLVGWTDAGEGAGDETAGSGARLRGALVPDERSRNVAVNVSADGPAAERLQQLIVRPPVTRWPLDDDPGARAALAYIGGRVKQLGPHPRSAYWLKGDTLDFGAVIPAVQIIRAPRSGAFTRDDFETARDQLLQELLWVKNVRSYFRQLGAPYEQTIQEAFPASSTLADRLQVELKVDEQKPMFTSDWFELVESLLVLVGGFEGVVLEEEAEDVANVLVETSASAMEASDFGYQTVFNGSNTRIEDNRRLRADELARELTEDARSSIAALERMGNAIVSDPTKLEEVGTYGGCNAAGGGCDPGYEEYGIDEGDVTQAKQLASLALERTLYGQLMTRSFPVWFTGLARQPDPATRFFCGGDADSSFSPFHGAPPLAYAKSLEELDPTGAVTRWQTAIAVMRSGETYSWPSETVLHRMFDPVRPLAPDAGGLGMSAQDVFRERENVYVKTIDCNWEYPVSQNGESPEFFDEPQP